MDCLTLPMILHKVSDHRCDHGEAGIVFPAELRSLVSAHLLDPLHGPCASYLLVCIGDSTHGTAGFIRGTFTLDKSVIW